MTSPIGTRAVRATGTQPYPPPTAPASPVPVTDPPAGLAVPGLPMSTLMTMFLLAQAYRNAQIAISSHVRTSIDAFWRQYIHPDGFSDSFNVLRPLIGAMIVTGHEASAANAADFYQQSRVVSGRGFTNVEPQTLDQKYLDRVMNSVSFGSFYSNVKKVDAQQASEVASRALQGAGARLVMLGGRDTITNSVATDKHATGWERIIDGDACSFCSMLASRGGVYKKGTVDFRAHDHCHCTAQPVFRGQKPFGAKLSGEWQQVTRGKSGAGARAAWDEHWTSKQAAMNPEPVPVAIGQEDGNAIRP